MSAAPDAQLLEQFTRNQSEAAFAELVQRHIGLVYSAAFRKTGNPQQAEDITQAVFIIFAHKAGSLGPKTVIPGWLYHTARLVAANFQRAEMRRIHREQEAFMQSTPEESVSDTVWRELSPLLDDAMAGLSTTDRNAIVLRFFQNQSLADVGAALGIAERAAQKRVNRALEKLNRFFTRRGVSSTTAIIAGVISSNSVQAAPASVAKSVMAVTLAKGATASSSTLILVKGVLNTMLWTKIKAPLRLVRWQLAYCSLPWLLIHLEKCGHNLFQNSNIITANSLNKIKNTYQVVSIVTNASGTISTKYMLKDKASWKKRRKRKKSESAEKVLEIETNFFKKIPQGVVIRPHAQNPYGNTQIIKDENHEIGMDWSCQQLLAIAYGTEGRDLPLSRILSFRQTSPAGEFDYLINGALIREKEHLQAEIQKYFRNNCAF